MALIKCPECGQEVSNQAPACIHCGYPLNEKTDTPINDQAKQVVVPKLKTTFSKKQKIIAVACLVAIILISYLGLFHLGTDERYTYNLIIENAGDFKNPKGIEVISGTAGWSDDDDEPYAFVCITSTNGYGAESAGYYLLGPDYIYDVSDDSGSVMFCKRDKLNTGTINRRLSLYWMLH